MSYEEKMIIKGSIKRSIEYKKRYIEDCESGLIDDIEGCISAKEEILRLESDLEMIIEKNKKRLEACQNA